MSRRSRRGSVALTSQHLTPHQDDSTYGTARYVPFANVEAIAFGIRVLALEYARSPHFGY